MNSKTIFNQILLLSFLTLCCLSCGTRSKIPKVSPISVSISGDLADYIQVVDNKYEIAGSYGNGVMAIKIKGLKPIEESKIKNKNIELSAILFGGDGEPLSGVAKFTTTDEDSTGELRDLLKKGSGEIVISLASGFTGYDQGTDGRRVKQFIISSRITEKKKADVTTTSNETSNMPPQDPPKILVKTYDELTKEDNARSDQGNENADEMLDAYEKITDDYIESIKYSDNDDGSALMGYAEYQQKALRIQKQLESDKNKLSDEQNLRMVNIQMRVLKAVGHIKRK